jgi:uncharacterized protein with HEPN domain
MRPRDSRTAIEDALAAGHAVDRFLAGRTLDQYVADELVRSAVERQFEIIGEALSRALRADSSLSSDLPEARAVIGFRNVLAHGYDAVVDETVYDLASEALPVLMRRLTGLLEELE